MKQVMKVAPARKILKLAQYHKAIDLSCDLLIIFLPPFALSDSMKRSEVELYRRVSLNSIKVFFVVHLRFI